MIHPEFPTGSPTGNIYLDSLINGGSFTSDSDQQTTLFWTTREATVSNYHLDNGRFATAAWKSYEVQALTNALQQWSNVCNIEFIYTKDPDQADLAESLVSKSVLKDGDKTIGGHHFPSENQSPSEGWYAWNGWGWSKTGLLQGGIGFNTILHEIGHALGLAHPHDGGTNEDKSVFPGVDSSDARGDLGLNQKIWTIMSYINGWDKEFSPYHDIDPTYGSAGTPMAFDIAAIQYIYGANMTYRTGADVYELPQENASGTYWSCIWDAGGEDVISFEQGSANCTIDLRAAPLSGPNAGGYVSHVDGIVGGFTIANGVVIENAIGGSGHDVLIGDDHGNRISGGSGHDSISGNGGDDYLSGGRGEDTLSGNDGNDYLSGGAERDFLNGGGGNDTLFGGTGFDSIDGGEGVDVAVYSNDWSDYFFEYEANDVRVYFIDIITDVLGIDTELVKNVEIFQFGEGDAAIQVAVSDLIVNHAPLLANPIEDRSGSIDLVRGVSFRIPSNAFVEIDRNDSMTFSVELVSKDGEPHDDVSLPAWLSFNPGSQRFKGTPGLSDTGTYTFQVTATDKFSASTSDTFSMTLMAPATEQDDLIIGGGGDDLLEGLGGNDTLIGGEGIDMVSYANAPSGVKVRLAGNGIAGNGVASGGDGKDVLQDIEHCEGSDYNDFITGSGLNNALFGGAGDDVITGGKGDDELFGDAGKDKLTGGLGSDSFIFDFVARQSNDAGDYDIIVDFHPGEDVLVFDTFPSDQGIAGYSALTRADSSIFYSGSKAKKATQEGQLLIYNEKTGMLYYDEDGLGGESAVAVCKLVGSPLLTFGDITIVE